MKIGGVETFLPHNPVIYLHIEPTPELLAVRQTVLHAIGSDKHRHFTPHLTLTMRLDASENRSVASATAPDRVAHAADGASTIDHLWLMQRGPNDPAWRYYPAGGDEGMKA